MTAASGAVLVIKLGALGDFVQALGPFAAIRRHHDGAPITLLTTAPFVPVARATPYFSSVWADERAAPWQVARWLRLRGMLRRGCFSRVYDLQTSTRSSSYLQLFRPGPMPEWSGIARGCSHLHANPGRDHMHTLDRQAEQLAMAGIEDVPAPTFSWCPDAPLPAGSDARTVLLVPGGAAHRPAKRWPDARYAALADKLSGSGLRPVLIGGGAEAALHQRIRDLARCDTGLTSLAGRTDLLDLIRLARVAAGAIGNDTGPMHLLAAAGCPSLVLYSHESDPALCAQRGPVVSILRAPALADLSVDAVVDAFETLSKQHFRGGDAATTA